LNDAKDTLALNGTLILTGSKFDVTKITGKGEIAVVDTLFDDVSVDFANILNVGKTSENFRGTAYENADDSFKKAVKWDGSEEYLGWLSGGGDGVLKDTIDYIKFTAQEDGTLNFNSDGGVSLEIVGQQDEWNSYGEIDVRAGTTYTIKLEREESNSASYELSFLA
jgi:hypothetical protein